MLLLLVVRSDYVPGNGREDTETCGQILDGIRELVTISLTLQVRPII